MFFSNLDPSQLILLALNFFDNFSIFFSFYPLFLDG